MNKIISTSASLSISVLMASLIALLAMSSFPSSASIQEGLDAYHNGDYQQAKKLLDSQILTNQTNDQFFHYLGRIAYLRGELAEAESSFKRAIALDNQKTDHFYWLAVTHAAQFNDVSIFGASSLADRFLVAAERAIQLDPKSIPAHQGLLKFYINAPGIIGGSLKNAQQTAHRIAELDSTAGLMALAKINQYEDEYEKAEIGRAHV